MIDADTLLATTRAVRRRLDLTRPVERHLLEECISLAQQAPSGGNRQVWSFVVVTDPERRLALAELYRRGWERYVTEGITEKPVRAADPEARARQKRITSSARYLADHLHEVPVLVVPCIRTRTEASRSVAGSRIVLHAGRTAHRTLTVRRARLTTLRTVRISIVARDAAGERLVINRIAELPAAR